MTRLHTLLLAAALAAPPALLAAQESAPLQEYITSGVSQPSISITANFSGEEILIYGAIERNRLLKEEEPGPDVILVVEGPPEPILVRHKTRVAGIWINRHASLISAAPSFYSLGSTAPLEDILDPHFIEIHDIGPEQAVLSPGTIEEGQNPEDYRLAAIRIKEDSGLYQVNPGSVRVIGKSLFESRVQLPSNITEGDYRVTLMLVRDRFVLDSHTEIIPVRRTGIERFIYRLAQDEPHTYGLLAIFVAILAGWLAAETFRRLRV